MSIHKEKKSCDTPVANRIKEARKEIGLTQQEAALRGNVSVQSWRDYEAGRAEPKLCTLTFLHSCNISLAWIATGEGSKWINESGGKNSQGQAPQGIIEEWVKDVREKEGGDGRIVMELSVQVSEFRQWYQEKKSKSSFIEESLAKKNVA